MRISVWNTAFLGDAVLTLPLIQSLRLRYPDATIDFYVRGGLEALFTAHPALNTVYGYHKRGKERGLGGVLRLGRELAGRGYDLWIGAHGSVRSACLARMSGAKRRVGYLGGLPASFAYTDTVNRRFDELEEIERLLELLGPLGVGPKADWPELALPPEAHAAAEALLDDVQGPLLGLHPGSVWPTKRWPGQSFARVGAMALERGASVALFAGPGEEAIAASVKSSLLQAIPDAAAKIVDLSGKLSLPVLAACIGHLSCYLTNDSGPMHLAWAQRVPVTAVFGPTVRDLGFFPRGATSSVIEIPLPCRPCGLHGPKTCPLGHHHCMTRVTPELVWEDVRGKLWP